MKNGCLENTNNAHPKNFGLNSSGRLEWLDFGKAMGILVVLLVHAGCRLGLVTYYGGMFYMPIFFVAAGYTYRVKEGESYGTFLLKKAKRLLIPYFGTSAFLWVFFWVKDCVLGGIPGDLKLASLFGILYSRNQMWRSGYAGSNPVLMDILNSPLWFLTALFLVYAWYGLISRSQKKYWLLGGGLAVSVIWHYAAPLLLPWSLEAVPYFTVFFAAGEKLKEWGGVKTLTNDIRLGIACLNFFLLLGFLSGSVNLSCGNYGVSMLLYLAVGIFGSYIHIRHRRPAGSKMSASNAGMWYGGPADVTDSVLSHVPLHVPPDRSRCAGAGRRTDQNSDGGGKSGGADGGRMGEKYEKIDEIVIRNAI